VHKDAALKKRILALDKGLNLQGQLMVAFVRNLEEALETVVAERPALRAFRALVKAKGSVKATGTQLLELIEPLLDSPKDARYPTSGKAMAKLLREHERFMPEIEIEFNVRTGKDRDRNIVARWKSAEVAVVPMPPKEAAKPKKEKRVAPDQPTFL